MSRLCTRGEIGSIYRRIIKIRKTKTRGTQQGHNPRHNYLTNGNACHRGTCRDQALSVIDKCGTKGNLYNCEGISEDKQHGPRNREFEQMSRVGNIKNTNTNTQRR